MQDIDPSTQLPRMHFPCMSADAATLLVCDRDALGVGIDTLSPDGGSCSAGTFAVHHAILGRDRYIVENLCLTAAVPARGATVFVAPLNVAGAPEAPARVWVMLDAKEDQDGYCRVSRVSGVA